MKKYTEKEVEDLISVQRGNCYVAVLNATQDKTLALIAASAPEPGQWRKSSMEYERFNHLISEAYENYSEEYEKDNSVGLSLLVQMVDGRPTYRKPDLEMFEAMCTHDKSFSDKWGLKIEKRELSLEERYDLIEKDKHKQFVTWQSHGTNRIKEVMDEQGVPTKLITVTYKDERIEIYE